MMPIATIILDAQYALQIASLAEQAAQDAVPFINAAIQVLANKQGLTDQQRADLLASEQALTDQLNAPSLPQDQS